jgi:hypothetical protein
VIPRKKVLGYKANKFDQGAVKIVYLCSQSEIWEDSEDAKAGPGLFEKIDSMADMLDTIAFVGGALELLPIPDGAQINPWRWRTTVSGSMMPTVAEIGSSPPPLPPPPRL